MAMDIARLQALRLPIIASPMFIVSGPELVIAQCKAGIVGSFPALNARAPDTLDGWLTRITGELAQHDAAHPDRPAAPFAVNHIIHATNTRLDEDLETCAKHRVPITITSLQAPGKVAPLMHAHGGIVLHDVVNTRHAKKALAEGADGLIAVCAGAGGHAGRLSPFALIVELRAFFDGPLALSGAIASGEAILAAQAMGADFAYMGTRFIAATEANAAPGYKDAVVEAGAEDIVYTDFVTGVPANFLRSSIVAMGLDPNNMPAGDKSKASFSSTVSSERKAWRDIWGAGQSVAAIADVRPVAEIVDGLEHGYRAAMQRLQRLQHATLQPA